MTTTLRILSAGLLVLLAQPVAAQDATPDIATLARQVGGAHRPDGPTAKVEAFTCQLELHLLDVSEKNGGQANLEVDFLQQAREAPKKPRTFIRYKVRGVDRAIRRGFDRFGPWHIQQGKPADLTAAGAQRDLESLREHTNLARQLLRFLSPEAVIGSLEAPTQVSHEALRIGRKSAAVYGISGRLPAFPWMQRAGSDAPAYVTIYVDKSSKRLLGIDAWPVKDGVTDRSRGERILLSDLQLRDGLLIPRTLRYLWRNAAGKLRSHSTAKIITLDLSPKLDVKHFDRS